jgi:ribose 5-phosphate isomerase B
MGELEVEGIKVPIGNHIGKIIVFGCDHRGFKYKQEVIEFLKKEGCEVIDMGTHSDERCDYPLISQKIAKEVGEDIFNKVGIGICGSGIGILIPAGKFQKIITARCLNSAEAETSRKHNNTNFLGIGADMMDLETIKATINTWLKTGFYTNPETDEAYLKRYLQTIEIEEQRD